MSETNLRQSSDINLASLLDLGANRVRDELADKVLEVDGRSLLGHNVGHLLADLLDLSSLSIGGLPQLVCPLLGEGNARHPQLVAVGGGDVDGALDGGLPLLDEGADLVSGHVHSVEVAKAVLSGDVLQDESTERRRQGDDGSPSSGA